MTSPELSLVQASLPSLLHVLQAETAFFANALDEVVLAHAGVTQEELKTGDPDVIKRVHAAVSEVDHLEAVEAAVIEHSRQAARALVPSIYLNGASITAQERSEKTGVAVPAPQLVTDESGEGEGE